MTPLFTMGARVRLKEAQDFFNIGAFPAGAAGTVVEIDDLVGYAAVKLDDHFDDLDSWDNCLYVYADDADVSEVIEGMFEPCGF